MKGQIPTLGDDELFRRFSRGDHKTLYDLQTLASAMTLEELQHFCEGSMNARSSSCRTSSGSGFPASMPNGMLSFSGSRETSRTCFHSRGAQDRVHARYIAVDFQISMYYNRLTMDRKNRSHPLYRKLRVETPSHRTASTTARSKVQQ